MDRSLSLGPNRSSPRRHAAGLQKLKWQETKVAFKILKFFFEFSRNTKLHQVICMRVQNVFFSCLPHLRGSNIFALKKLKKVSPPKASCSWMPPPSEVPRMVRSCYKMLHNIHSLMFKL